MPTPNTDQAIRTQIDQFLTSISALVRQAAVEAVKDALGATDGSLASPARRRPGPPRKAATDPKAAKRGHRSKASSADAEAVANRVLVYVKANPGSRLEEIGRGMGVATAGLKAPIKGLLAAGALRTEGQKRGTKYLPGRAGARTKAGTTRPGPGDRRTAKRGKKAGGRVRKK